MISRRETLKSAALLPLGAALRAGASPVLSAPPLAGHFTADSVRLWLQSTAEGSATIAYWPADGPEEKARTAQARFMAADECSALVELTGLAAATSYRYRVALEGGAGATGAFRTGSAPGSSPRAFRVYLGSCAYTEAITRSGRAYGANHQIFDAMAAAMAADRLPHFMLWMGDNLYLRNDGGDGHPADYATPEAMARRYREVRGKAMLARLLGATHHYALWDDHDYGDNNSDRRFARKDESLRLFRTYWPNPPREPGAPAAICTRFTQEDAEFFLLDDRWDRDPEKDPPGPGKAMFGRAQMAWLKRSILASRATFRVVAGGSQFLSEAPNGVESGWHNYATERDDFLAWFDRERPRGVLLLSGDRHNTQLFRRPGAVELAEFSCSPLTSKASKLNAHDRANPRLDPGTAVEAQNFGTLEFEGEGAARRVVARCHDSDGRLRWTRTLATAG